MIELCVVAPMYNEEKNIEYFFETLQPVLNRLEMTYEIICVDDGSTDGTWKKLLACHQAEPRIKIMSFSRNFGKEVALTAGLNHAGGAAIVPIDADLQDPPEMIAGPRSGGERSSRDGKPSGNSTGAAGKSRS